MISLLIILLTFVTSASLSAGGRDFPASLKLRTGHRSLVRLHAMRSGVTSPKPWQRRGVGDSPAAAAAQVDRPMPDVQAFAAEVRARLRTDRALQSQYTYLERREEISVSKLGKVRKGPTKLYEVYPSGEPGNTYKRLISVNGVLLTPEEMEAQDRKHREDVLREMARRDSESPEDREKRLRKDAKERAEEQAVFDEIFALYDIRLVGRDLLDGEPMIVATLDPKPDYEPRTDEGKLMKKVRARAWISETDYQVVRVEIEVIDDVTFGWGILGRLHAGTRGEFERRKVNDEVWLPSRVALHASGRALLFRTFKLETVTTYSDYRKFNVETEETYGQKQ